METDSLQLITIASLLATLSSLCGIAAGYLSPRLAKLNLEGSLIKFGLLIASIAISVSRQCMKANFDLSMGGVIEALVLAVLFAGFYYWIGTTSWFKKLVS